MPPNGERRLKGRMESTWWGLSLLSNFDNLSSLLCQYVTFAARPTAKLRITYACKFSVLPPMLTPKKKVKDKSPRIAPNAVIAAIILMALLGRWMPQNLTYLCCAWFLCLFSIPNFWQRCLATAGEFNTCQSCTPLLEESFMLHTLCPGLGGRK